MRYPLFLVRQLGHTVSKKMVRTGARHLPFLGKDRNRQLERWLRGREDWRKLRLADAVAVSFGKSGRTWLRVLLSRVYQLQHGLGERAVIGFDNLHYQTGAVPKIMFTHDNYVKDYTGHRETKEDFYDKKVIFLARDPRDVAVSQYFQWKYRMKPNKKDINAYPTADLEPFEPRHGRVARDERLLPDAVRHRGPHRDREPGRRVPRRDARHGVVPRRVRDLRRPAAGRRAAVPRPVPPGAAHGPGHGAPRHAAPRRPQRRRHRELRGARRPGPGQMVGLVLEVDNVAGGWYGEGDDMVFVDGDPWPPRIHGTGHEEVFGAGACVLRQYAGPYSGVHLVESPEYRGLVGMYRWYVADPIRFDESLRWTVEHGHANNFANHYASVAYWYQDLPHAPFPPLPARDAMRARPCPQASTRCGSRCWPRWPAWRARPRPGEDGDVHRSLLPGRVRPGARAPARPRPPGRLTGHSDHRGSGLSVVSTTSMPWARAAAATRSPMAAFGNDSTRNFRPAADTT